MSKKEFKKSKYKYKERVFSEPPAKEKVKIRKRAKEMRSGKVKLMSLGDLIRKLEKMI